MVSYILASIRLLRFGPPSVTASFDIPLVSICALFDFNSSCLMRVRMPQIHFLVKPWVSNFYHDYNLPWKRRLSCRYYTLHIDGVFPPQYQKTSITLARSSNILLAKYVFVKVSLHINIFYAYFFLQSAYVCNPSPFGLYIIIFVRMMTFETHGHFIYGKCVTKRSNEWKYKSHRQKKRLKPPICELCFRWGFDHVVLSRK